MESQKNYIPGRAKGNVINNIKIAVITEARKK
jgi:hypothetical protein